MRYLVTILGLALAIGGLVYVKFAQISSLIGMGEAMAKAGPPPEATSTAQATSQTWETTIAAVGTVASSKGVTVSSEISGVVVGIEFESGAAVEKGAVLLQLDARVERAQLASAQVRRNLALTTVKRARVLASSGALSQTQIDGDESALASAAAEIEVLRAQIARKTIRAPFAGRLGIRAVNLGQYLNPGTTITTLEGTSGLYVDFELPQQQDVTLGMAVRVTLAGVDGFTSSGEIVAVDPTVDPRTRNKKLRASLPQVGATLEPGMFAQVAVIRPEKRTVVVVPATAVVYATFGDSLFIVEAPKEATTATGPNGEPVMSARQAFVRLGERRGDFVAIAEGLESGQTVVVAGAFKLRNNARVYVDNSRPLTPELAPRPENR